MRVQSCFLQLSCFRTNAAIKTQQAGHKMRREPEAVHHALSKSSSSSSRRLLQGTSDGKGISFSSGCPGCLVAGEGQRCEEWNGTVIMSEHTYKFSYTLSAGYAGKNEEKNSVQIGVCVICVCVREREPICVCTNSHSHTLYTHTITHTAHLQKRKYTTQNDSLRNTHRYTTSNNSIV
jgi:hypothetical protein